MNSNPQSWSLIIFAFNEEPNIESVVNKSLFVLNQLTTNNHELIIIDDGSTDKTRDIINRLSVRHKEIITVHHASNLGIGRALLSGYQIARYENICAIPADGQFNPEDLIPFAIIPDDYVISFYRKKKIRYSLYRKFLSYTNKTINRLFLGIKIKDVNWIKIYKRNFILKIPRVLSSSLVESEICAKVILNGYKIIEVESEYHKRAGGTSKGGSLKIIVQGLKELFILIYEIRSYKKFKKQ